MITTRKALADAISQVKSLTVHPNVGDVAKAVDELATIVYEILDDYSARLDRLERRTGIPTPPSADTYSTTAEQAGKVDRDLDPDGYRRRGEVSYPGQPLNPGVG